MKTMGSRFWVMAAICCLAVPSVALAASTRDALPQVQPAELAAQVSSKKAPLLFQVGFRVLYAQAHIPGSRYVGPTNDPKGLEQLRAAVQSLPKDTAIVLYCGCCPWARCPNVIPAYDALLKLHFTHVKVLAIEKNFGADWVDKGYPVERGAPAEK